MNVDAYNLDSLRTLVRKLEKENQNLKQKLNEANIPYNSENIFDEFSEGNKEYDLDHGGRIVERYITENMAKWYFSMFWGRDDVYAKRGSKGVKALNITEKNGTIASFKLVEDNKDVMIITNSGMIMRMPLEQISTLGRVDTRL